METTMMYVFDKPLTCEECTRRMTQIYHEQLLPMQNLCRSRGITFRLCGSMIHVATAHESWYVCMHVRTGRLMLLHRSLCRPHESKTPHYHEQACRSDSLTELLSYIIDHEDLRMAEADEAARRQMRRVQRQREQQTRLQQRRRLARLLSRLEAREGEEAPVLAPAV
ncbi:MAG: hypothetical protein IKK57_11395 [Clostridia bacterium]|nr:hypothetical protein [Clostridia bacterium]